MTRYEKSARSLWLAVLGMVLCVAGALVTTAEALTIDAHLVSFESTDADLNSTGPAGGIGAFALLSDVTGTDVDFLGPTFMAQCLEPSENVSSGTSYQFQVVDLALAPTSRVGGMGAENARWLEAIMGGLGFDSVEDVAAASAVMQSAVQMATYEAGYETTGVFGFDVGTAQLTGIGSSEQANLTSVLDDHTDVRGFALLNIANLDAAGRTRTVYQAQDFAVYRTVDVPEPLPLALIGLGLVGAGLRYRGVRNG